MSETATILQQVGPRQASPLEQRAHLVPPEGKERRRLSRPMLFAIATAVVLHLLIGALVLARIPGMLVPAPPGLPPHTAEVEMIQDNAATTSDAKLGAGKQTPEIPAPAPTPTPPPSPQPQGGPNLLTDPHGETPPPGEQAPQQPVTPPQVQPPQPQPPQTTPTPALPQAPQQANQDSTSTPEIRLGNEDDGEQSSGGEADHPSAPDPDMPNLKPAYPTDAARRGESGTVEMLVHVAPDGTALQVVVANSSGSQSLDTAATGAVKHWRFRAAVQGGKPVDSYTPVELNFVLRHK